MLKGLLAILTVAYPLIVYLALDHVQPRYLALLLTALFVLRWLERKSGTNPLGGLVVLIPGSVLFLAIVGVTNETVLLLAYPVFVSALFFAVFSYSLFRPPTVAERLARLQDPHLPPQGVAYTRKVTVVWCGFFLANGLVSAGTVWHGDRFAWSLYNGCLSYVFMGVLMALEMLVRRKVRRTF
jgi:uncharacterized membrane protein